MEKIPYTKTGDYLIPDIEFPTMELQGKYARLRADWLKQHKRALYEMLLLEGMLTDHCNQIGAQAQEMEDQIVEMTAPAVGLTEQLKAADQTKWAGQMNMLRLAAEETVTCQLICR